jgi:amidase
MLHTVLDRSPRALSTGASGTQPKGIPMELREYAQLDATALSRLVRAGKVTACEVESVARQALASTDCVLNGLALPPFNPALDHAAGGPLCGVPFLIKDSGPMAKGVPFFCGSRSVKGAFARSDSVLMRRIRAAGFVTLGLTTVPEMTLSFSTESAKYGPTRNPWALARGVGGSSGGAAALVAAGAVPIAHGNDGAGSIRVPASCCGLVGLKPSRGRTPCGPDLGEAQFGMSQEFGLTRTVRDAALYLDAIGGPDLGDKYPLPAPDVPYVNELTKEPGRLRVALTTRAWSDAPVDREVSSATITAGQMLDQIGHIVTEASPELDWEALIECLAGSALANAAPFLRAPRRQPAEMEAVSRRILEGAETLTALDLLAAFDAQNRLTRSLARFFEHYDLLVTPTLAQLPAPHGTLRYDDPGHSVTSWLRALFDYGPFTPPFNISGQPAISLPLAQSADGLPIGVQIIARFGREDLLFRIAAQLEQAMPWRDRAPEIFVGKSGTTPSLTRNPRA